MTAPKATLAFEHDDRVARVTLAAPKANILDRAMMADLGKALDHLQKRRNLAAIVFSANGPHFSFGASVEEHLPEPIGETLAALHTLLRRMVELPAPTIAAVRGQCLGGGFELVLACDLILAEENARLGSPEIKLAVFPPAATALLPLRIGVSRATDMVLTGASWTGTGAADAGLVARTAPEGALEATLGKWLEDDFLPCSPAALRHAARAIRRPIQRALDEDLPELERRYLHELMAEPDATEGIRAFLEKRQPRWSRKGEAA
jgi:cyclohexa-1,5-dienecarbonyl-CoA hydratase